MNLELLSLKKNTYKVLIFTLLSLPLLLVPRESNGSQCYNYDYSELQSYSGEKIARLMLKFCDTRYSLLLDFAQARALGTDSSFNDNELENCAIQIDRLGEIGYQKGNLKCKFDYNHCFSCYDENIGQWTYPPRK